MKRTCTRVLRSALSLVLVFCLALSLCGAAFATETAKKYVSLGDSMANGYGLSGYDDPYRVNGFLDEVEASYPAQVADHYGWELTPMATSAMRAEDLHYILEYPNGFQGDEYTKDEFIEGRWNDYGDYGFYEKSGVANVAELYQTNVAEADVITLGIGNANFGVFLLGRITNALGVLGGSPEGDAWIDFQNALVECDEETKAFALQAYDVLETEIAQRVPAGAEAIVEPLVNVFAYAITSYALNYGGVIEAIVELNPDAEIMIVGLMNTFSGMEMSYEGEIIDMGAIMDKVIGTVNAYLAALPATLQAANKYPEATFYYAAASNVSMIVDNFADEIYQEDTAVRVRTIEEVVDMVWPMLNSMTEAAGDGRPYIEITREEVEAYEKALADGEQSFAGYVAQNSGKLQSIATYLAFEKATINASQLEVLDANAFITLAAGLDGIFGGVYSAFESNIGNVANYDDEYKFAVNVNNALSAGGDGSDADMTETVYTLCALPDAMSSALIEDETVHSLLNLFARMLIGNGIGCHPAAGGHDTLTDAIIASYDEKHTAKDETIENIEITLDALYNVLVTYGPEVAAEVWNQWVEYGYVESVEKTMGELEEMLTARYEYYTETALPAIETAVGELAAQKDALCAELDVLKTQLEAKKAELEKVISEQEIGSVTLPDISIDIELGNNEQTEVPENECLGVIEGASVEEELQAAIADLEHAIAVIEALITDIEADIADMVALAEQIAAAVAELEKTMTDIAAAAEDLAAAVEAAIAVLQDNDGIVDAVISSFDAARATVLAANDVLELALGVAEEITADIDTMVEKIAVDAEALYNKFLEDLPKCIEQIPEEGMMLIGGAVMAAQYGLEEGKALIEAKLTEELAALEAEYGMSKEEIEAELKKLAEEYGITEESIQAELDAIYGEIEAEAKAQYAAVEAQLQADIAALEAEAAAKIEALEAEKAALEAQLEAAAEDAIAGIQAQIDRVTGDIATVNEDLACAIEHLKAAAQTAYDQIVAEVTAAYEAAIAELEQALADLEAAYEAAVAELEQKLADLKAAYDKAVDELTAAADKAIADLTAKVEAQLEELGKIGEELGKIVDSIYAELHDELEAAQAAIEEILKGNLEAIEDLKNILVELGAESVIDLVESIVAQIEALFEEATTADYVITPDSYYVAIGDGSAETESYVEELAVYLGIKCDNLAEDGQEMADAYGVIADNAEDIAAADLITIGYSNSTFAAEAFNAALDGADLDWSAYVTDAGVAYVEDVLAEISAELAANGITGDYNARAMDAIEAYAYSSVAYACNLPGVVSAIREVNEDAVVIIVGQHNAFAGTTLAFEGVEIDLGEYVDYLVDGAAVHGIAYCMITGDAIYVEAPDAATDMPAEIGMETLIAFMRDDFSVLYPNATGDLYIRDKILNALNITTQGLLGDANSDGIVDSWDATLVARYDVGKIGAGDLNLSVCDVSGDGVVDSWDATLIARYDVGKITVFPAA